VEMEVLEKEGGITWVRMTGRLDLPGVEKIEKNFLGHAGPGRPMVVDLSGVPFVGSLGIAMFFQAAKILKHRKAKLVLLSAASQIEKTFRTVGLSEFATLARSEEEARAAATSD